MKKIFSIAFIIIGQLYALVELPKVEDNDIIKTAAIIRYTTNQIFSSLNLKRVKDKPKLKQYSTLYNYLISLTAQDYKTLKEIAKLTRVDNKNINNDTENFMNTLNELLNEDSVLVENGITLKNAKDDDSIIRYIENFLTDLDYLKEIYGVNKVSGVNSAVIKHLEDEEWMLNITEAKSYDNDNQDAENDSNIINDIEFWEPSGRRIYRGDRTKISEFPFMASIQIFKKFQCAGSIIKSDLVITAASCLQLAWNNRFFRENPAFLSVRVGSTFYAGGGEEIAVLEAYFYPNYNPKTLQNNISVLRLIRRIKFRGRSKGVKKIDFDRHASNLPMTTDGITIVGWGAKRPGNVINEPYRNALSYAVLDVYPLQECRDVYSKEYVTMKNFCAGFFSRGGGACNRDVGGPGIVGGVLMGIISFGSPVCGAHDAPTVFTKVGYYTDWIEEIMEQPVPNTKRRTTLKTSEVVFAHSPSHFYEETTFKIPPFVMTKSRRTTTTIPPPVEDADSLRILENRIIFKEFLKTMFSSTEFEEYQDLINGLTDGKNIKHNANVAKVQTVAPETIDIDEAVEYTTKIEDFDPPTTPEYYSNEETLAATVIDKNLAVNKGTGEENINQLIEDVETDDGSDSEPSGGIQLEMPIIGETTSYPDKLIDDSILTLLYLSDNEKKDGNIKKLVGENLKLMDEKDDLGLSISADMFRDLTYRNNETGNIFNLVPRSDLYDILIDTVNKVENENKNT